MNKQNNFDTWKTCQNKELEFCKKIKTLVIRSLKNN